MSLKAELEIWQSALTASESDLPRAIALFNKIGDTSKIEWNIGVLLAKLGRHLEAIARYRRATELDDWLVIAWYQCGISRFMLGQYEAAYRDFEAAHTRMRGNDHINYTQLGLPYCIHISEILLNRGLALINLGQVERGMADLAEAAIDTSEERREVIGIALRLKGRGCDPLAVPDGLLFQPSQGKLKNLAPRNYMGKAVLIAATSPSDAYTTFTGVTRLNRGETPSGIPLPFSHPLAKSASTSNLRPPRSANISDLPVPDATPIASRMSRGSARRFGSVDETSPRTVSGFVRPHNEKTTSLAYLGIPDHDTAAQLAYLPIIQPSTPPRKAPSPPALTCLVIPSPPNPLPRTPISTSAVSAVVNEYYSPDSDSGTRPLQPKPRPRADSIMLWEKEGIDKRYASPSRSSPSPPISFNRQLSQGLGRSGSVMTSRNALGLTRQGSMASSMRYDDDWEMTKIRLKVHITGHTRALSLPSTATFTDVISSLRTKFPNMATDGVGTLLFRDEDGDMMSMVDEGDWEAGVDVARVLGGKLEVWVE
ncbi:uncharacterized protein MKK02DRAFT_29207 [Dioszegia hungarica]|uniref:PB1 domain-containing protein n=1 Tax=Dioszegia hungarica TaxID=4972 RepID=A0AA38HHA5_9TREE|nr:uncharacterized protein MKK02DRAFT_29207 [Dioszegia hungarica]KAI9639069.1 hypothetical protein MKK02DRAFT_29207 [Dioszegia hungarica]